MACTNLVTLLAKALSSSDADDKLIKRRVLACIFRTIAKFLHAVINTQRSSAMHSPCFLAIGAIFSNVIKVPSACGKVT